MVRDWEHVNVALGDWGWVLLIEFVMEADGVPLKLSVVFADGVPDRLCVGVNETVESWEAD